MKLVLGVGLATLFATPVVAGERASPPRAEMPSAKSTPASHRDRVYTAEQFSNTVSVTDPVDGKLLGVIRLGEPQPANFSPLYRGQVLVHGLGASPDGSTLAVVSVGSNAVTFIDTATNAVKHTTYIGRSPHEATFTPDGKEVWVTVRGEDYIAILDPKTFEEKARLKTPGGPGMAAFSPDGQYGYVCSSFNPELTIFKTATRKPVGKVTQPSPFCPNIAVSPDGRQVWYTLKDVGKVVAINAQPPFETLKIIDTGPITNHVNFARTSIGQFVYVTVGGLNEVKVFRADTYAPVATIPVGKLPHGLWPSGDGSRMFVGLENDDAIAVIDTATNKVISTVDIGQAPQAIGYVVNAVPTGDGTQSLKQIGPDARSFTLTLGAPDGSGEATTSVALFDQGLVQIVQASVTGLAPKRAYQLILASNKDGSGEVEPLANFVTNPAGAAIVNTTGLIRQLVNGEAKGRKRYLAVRDGYDKAVGAIVQVSRP